MRGRGFVPAKINQPIRSDRATAPLPFETVASRQALDPFHEGERLGHRTKHEIAEERGGSSATRDETALQQSPDLGGEDEPTTEGVEIERLDAERIAGEETAPLHRIPNGEGEHAPQPVHTGRPVTGIEPEDDLGVGAGAEGFPKLLKLGAQRAVIINLAVKRDGETPVRRGHGLMAGGAEVENGQAGVDETTEGRAGGWCFG